jgi:O-antigen ligase
MRWHYWPVAAATLLLLFFSIAELFRFFFVLLAVIGLYRLLRERRWPEASGFRLFAIAFACLWVPMLLSVLDAEFVRVSATTTARYLIYLLAAYLWIGAFQRHGNERALLGGAFAVLLFWTADALFQWLTGVNFFGEEAFGGQRLSGMMGPRLTVVLAIMAPVFFHALLRFGSRRRPLWLLVFPYLLVVLYGGSRIAWMLLALAVVLYGLLLWRMQLRVDLRKAIPAVVLAAAVGVIAVAQTDWIEKRIVVVGGIFSGDYETVDAAVNNRLGHWVAALEMYRENPVNGIGVKNYKFSQPTYAQDDEIFRGQPHLFLLEVGAETGSIGLIGLALLGLFTVLIIVQLARDGQFEAVPWGLSLLLAAFPLNATLSLYAHFMSALVFYLAMVFFAVAARERTIPSAGSVAT